MILYIKSKEFLPSAKLLNIDDFEFTIEFPAKVFLENSFVKNVVTSVLQICSLSFWADKRFKIHPFEEAKHTPVFNSWSR